MSTAHERPNGRPVHPACLATPEKSEIPCICDKLWQGWDGTTEDLDRHIARAFRSEQRARAVSNDDLMAYLEKDSRKSWDGFWSKAEELRCVGGEQFLRGDLNYGRFRSPNWERAKEANK